MKNNIKDVIIIGAGPAGMSAALYLKRAGIDPIIIEKESPGGTLNKITDISNYPGYNEKDGPTLAFRMYSQLEEIGLSLVLDEVEIIEDEDNCYKIVLKNNIYYANNIILASGKVPKKLDVENAEKYEGKGISYCALCDGTLYKDKTVAIVGAGNSALQAASYLSNVAKKIYILVRSNKIRATEKVEVLDKDNVEVLYSTKIEEIVGKDTINKIKTNNNVLDVDGIFVYIGNESNSAYYESLGLDNDKNGIIVDSNMQTSKKGIYAVGDIVSKNLYQVVTAVSEGAIAAVHIINNKNS